MNFRNLCLALGLLAAASAHAQTGPVKTVNGVLVGANGMTLYTFDKDAGDKSMCNGPCATNWPPLMAEGHAGRRLHDHHPRRWQEADRVQGQAVVLLGEGHQGRRHDRRQRQQCLARRQAVADRSVHER